MTAAAAAGEAAKGVSGPFINKVLKWLSKFSPPKRLSDLEEDEATRIAKRSSERGDENDTPAAPSRYTG